MFIILLVNYRVGVFIHFR